MKRHLFLVLSAVALLAVSALTSAADDTGSATPAATPAVQQDLPKDSGSAETTPVQDPLYQIQQEDVLQVDVWGEPALQRLQLQVTPDGYINVAYVGSIKVAGLTAQKLSETIAKRLMEDEILKDPKVQVTVVNVHRLQVRVLGQVNRPGMVEIKDGDTVLEAIAQAGSYTAEAYLEGATITHNGKHTDPLNLKNLFHKGDLSQNYELKKGDTIYIPEDTTNKFFVMGEVLRPGQYQLKDNTTILSAIMQANGPTQRAAMKSAVLIRGDAKNPERVPVDMTKLISKADMSQNIDLQPGDVVWVPETSKPDWSKISQIINVISSVGLIRRYGLF